MCGDGRAGPADMLTNPDARSMATSGRDNNIGDEPMEMASVSIHHGSGAAYSDTVGFGLGIQQRRKLRMATGAPAINDLLPSRVRATSVPTSCLIIACARSMPVVIPAEVHTGPSMMRIRSSSTLRFWEPNLQVTCGASAWSRDGHGPDLLRPLGSCIGRPDRFYPFRMLPCNLRSPRKQGDLAASSQWARRRDCCGWVMGPGCGYQVRWGLVADRPSRSGTQPLSCIKVLPERPSDRRASYPSELMLLWRPTAMSVTCCCTRS
jgi:hypothetical protein